MFRCKATPDLQGLIVLDEGAGYIPPHPYSPPTKKPLSILLAQGRAHGLGVVIGTQNPNDLDYKALSNVGTWFLGNLRKRDIKRDLESILKDKGVDETLLSNLEERQFLVIQKSGKIHAVRSRWALSYLRGPMDINDVNALPSECRMPKVIAKLKGALSGYIDIAADLADPTKPSADIEVFYSTDQGKTWHNCSIVDGETQLRNRIFRAYPMRYKFTWDSSLDLVNTAADKVIIHIRPKGGKGVNLPTICVDNRKDAVAC
jgi:hypothetical protein